MLNNDELLILLERIFLPAVTVRRFYQNSKDETINDIRIKDTMEGWLSG